MTQPLTIDFQGHFRTGPGGARPQDQHDERLSYIIKRITSAVEIDAMYQDTPRLGADRTSFLSLWTHTCQDCGEEVTMEASSNVARACTPCAYPTGMPAFSVSLDVPSGVIVFANDFRDIVPLSGIDSNHDINQMLEMKRCTEDYAAEGMIHVYVGNSCPQVRKMQDGTIQVQNHGYRSSVPGRSKGNVCTDLWWVCAMDQAEFARRCNERNVSQDDFGDLIRVRVEPGAWSFSVDYAQDRDVPVLYTKGQRTGPCVGWTRPVDAYARPKSFLDSHFWAMVQLHNRKYNYPLSYFLEHAFCVLGNGMGWNQGRLTHEEHDRPAFSHNEPLPIQVGPLPHAGIPVFDAGLAYGDRRHGVYPMSLGQFPNMAAQAPRNIDVYWLAAALILFQSLARSPEVLSHRSPAEHEIQVQVVGRTLAILDDLATGRWAELEAVFQDMQPVWSLVNAGLRESLKTEPSPAEPRVLSSQANLEAVQAILGALKAP